MKWQEDWGRDIHAKTTLRSRSWLKALSVWMWISFHSCPFSQITLSLPVYEFLSFMLHPKPSPSEWLTHLPLSYLVAAAVGAQELGTAHALPLISGREKWNSLINQDVSVAVLLQEAATVFFSCFQISMCHLRSFTYKPLHLQNSKIRWSLFYFQQSMIVMYSD